MTDETTDELMKATYRALCKHGYASLRLQDIADESTKSKATLHYYYESKHDLLLAFLEYLYGRFEERLSEFDDTTPTSELTTVIEHQLTPRDESAPQRFRTALLEIKAQAPYDAAYRDHLVTFDRLLHDHIQAIIEVGIDQGGFNRDIDSDAVAEFCVTVINGAQSRHVALGHPVEHTRQMLLGYIQRHVLAADSGMEVVAK
jgi:AcrR family transcriptional regulator